MQLAVEETGQAIGQSTVEFDGLIAVDGSITISALLGLPRRPALRKLDLYNAMLPHSSPPSVISF